MAESWQPRPRLPRVVRPQLRRVRRHTRERQIHRALHETDGFDQAAALVEGQRGVDLDDAEDVLGGGHQANRRPTLHLQHQGIVLHADGWRQRRAPASR